MLKLCILDPALSLFYIEELGELGVEMKKVEDANYCLYPPYHPTID